MFLKKIFIVFVIISISLFFYGLVTDRSLGKGYRMVYLEPGCVIFGHKNGIYGDVIKFSISKRFIIGIVDKPNRWMKKVLKEGYINETYEGYFIIDKYNHTKKMKMKKKEFLLECKKNLKDCNLRYGSGLDPVYDPYYWYVILMNKFD